jgi:hypothetical protein
VLILVKRIILIREGGWPMKIIVILAVLALVSSVSSPSQAMIRFEGSGEKLNFSPSQFPPDMKSAFGIMNAKCIKCHSQERLVISIQTGIGPVSNLPFDSRAANKMLLKAKTNMSKEETKQVANLITYLITESAKR